MLGGTLSKGSSEGDLALLMVFRLKTGPRDKVTDEYCAWQESQVEESDQKAAYQRSLQNHEG